MTLIVRQTDPQKVRYNNIKGSGLFYRGPICELDSCKSKPNITPTHPKPVGKVPRQLVPLTAIKQGVDTNKWKLGNTIYKDFNSLWVNIPRQNFTRLKVDG